MIEMTGMTEMSGMIIEMTGMTATMKNPTRMMKNPTTKEEHEGSDSNAEINRSAESQAGRMYPQRGTRFLILNLMG